MSIGEGSVRIVSLDLLGAVCGALRRTGTAQNVLRKVQEVIAQDGPSPDAIAREASIAAAKNSSAAPQLLYAPILWTIEDAFESSTRKEGDPVLHVVADYHTV